jgi:hypothetical protein
MEWVMPNELNKKVGDATDKFLDRRALIFIEEAIAHYNGRHGVKKTRQYLQYMLDYLEEFETEERKDV